VRVKLVLLVILLASILSACGFGKKVEPTADVTSTPVPPPTPTATPDIPLAILVMPSDLDKSTSDAYQKVVYNLAEASGLRFQVRNTLTAADLDPALQVAVILPPDPGIAALAAAAPKAQFLAINLPGVTAGGNISVLGSTNRVDVAAFVAGYTAAMISTDFHTGMLLPQDNPDAQRAMVAFASGASYYCGICQPFYYSPISYPQFQAIPASEAKSNYPAYANLLLNDKKVYTLYLYPDIAVKELTDYLGTIGSQLIGTSLPDPKPAGWVMTIRPDETKAIQKAWPDLVAGKGGLNVQSPLGLEDVDPDLLSPGKERLAQQVLDDLQAGRIYSGAGQ
jgi:hypothetical protein